MMSIIIWLSICLNEFSTNCSATAWGHNRKYSYIAVVSVECCCERPVFVLRLLTGRAGHLETVLLITESTGIRYLGC